MVWKIINIDEFWTKEEYRIYFWDKEAANKINLDEYRNWAKEQMEKLLANLDKLTESKKREEYQKNSELYIKKIDETESLTSIKIEKDWFFDQFLEIYLNELLNDFEETKFNEPEAEVKYKILKQYQDSINEDSYQLNNKALEALRKVYSWKLWRHKNKTSQKRIKIDEIIAAYEEYSGQEIRIETLADQKQWLQNKIKKLLAKTDNGNSWWNKTSLERATVENFEEVYEELLTDLTEKIINEAIRHKTNLSAYLNYLQWETKDINDIVNLADIDYPTSIEKDTYSRIYSKRWEEIDSLADAPKSYPNHYVNQLPPEKNSKIIILQWVGFVLKDGMRCENFKVMAGSEKLNLLFYSTFFVDNHNFKEGEIYQLSTSGNFVEDTSGSISGGFDASGIIQGIDVGGYEFEKIRTIKVNLVSWRKTYGKGWKWKTEPYELFDGRCYDEYYRPTEELLFVEEEVHKEILKIFERGGRAVKISFMDYRVAADFKSVRIGKVLNISDDEEEDLTESDFQKIKEDIDRKNRELSLARGEIVTSQNRSEFDKSENWPKTRKEFKNLEKNLSKINPSKTNPHEDSEWEVPWQVPKKTVIEENLTETSIDTNPLEENFDFSSLTRTEKDNSISLEGLEKYLEMLGASKDDSLESIRSSYRKAALSLHPDKNASGKEEFQKLLEAMQAINAAWEGEVSSSSSSPLGLTNDKESSLPGNLDELITEQIANEKAKDAKSWNYSQLEKVIKRVFQQSYEHLIAYVKEIEFQLAQEKETAKPTNSKYSKLDDKLKKTQKQLQKRENQIRNALNLSNDFKNFDGLISWGKAWDGYQRMVTDELKTLTKVDPAITNAGLGNDWEKSLIHKRDLGLAPADYENITAILNGKTLPELRTDSDNLATVQGQLTTAQGDLTNAQNTITAAQTHLGVANLNALPSMGGKSLAGLIVDSNWRAGHVCSGCSLTHCPDPTHHTNYTILQTKSDKYDRIHTKLSGKVSDSELQALLNETTRANNLQNWKDNHVCSCSVPCHTSSHSDYNQRYTESQEYQRIDAKLGGKVSDSELQALLDAIPNCSHSDYDTLKSERDTLKSERDTLKTENDQLKEHKCDCDSKVVQKEKEIIDKIITDLELSTERERESTLEAVIAEIKSKITPPSDTQQLQTQLKSKEAQITELKNSNKSYLDLEKLVQQKQVENQALTTNKNSLESQLNEKQKELLTQILKNSSEVKEKTYKEEIIKSIEVSLTSQGINSQKFRQEITNLSSLTDIQQLSGKYSSQKLSEVEDSKKSAYSLNIALGVLSLASLIVLAYLLIKDFRKKIKNKLKGKNDY